jgi:2-hydroxy-4-carboxymuconate semialdehyde hemiacetal dehydrogenase
MAKPIKAALAGAGAFGLKHLDAIKEIGDVEVISLVGRELDKTKEAGRNMVWAMRRPSLRTP